jgi:hypothetical protein
VRVEDTPPLEPHPRKPPLPRDEIGGTTITATRQAAATTFAALHEPFRGGKPRVTEIRPLVQGDDVLAVAVTGKKGSGIDDRLMLHFGDDAEQPVTVENDGQSFTFAGHAYVRVGATAVEAIGNLQRMKIRLPRGSRPQLTVNGKPASATLADGFLAYEK